MTFTEFLIAISQIYTIIGCIITCASYINDWEGIKHKKMAPWMPLAFGAIWPICSYWAFKQWTKGA